MKKILCFNRGSFVMPTISGTRIVSFCFGFLLFGSSFANSELKNSLNPTYPEVIVDWFALEESVLMVDVSYRVVRCQAGDSPVIMLQVFNEGVDVSAVGFTLHITDNATGITLDRQVSSFPIPFGDIHQAACGSTANANLKIDVPVGFDPANLSIDITYN